MEVVRNLIYADNRWNKTHRNHGESKKNKQRNEPISKCPKYEG